MGIGFRAPILISISQNSKNVSIQDNGRPIQNKNASHDTNITHGIEG